MKSLRHRRRRIGATLAAVFLLTAVMPGLAAAAQGVQIQAPLCSPDGMQPPKNGLPVFASDEHCQLCPAGFLSISVTASASDGLSADAGIRDRRMPGRDEAPDIRRFELSPLNGRAPPLQG